MKFQIERTALAKGLSEVSKAVAKVTKAKKNDKEKKDDKKAKELYEPLGDILITAHKDTLTLTGCDSDYAIEIDLPLEGNSQSETYGFIVDKKSFLALVRNYRAYYLTIKYEEGKETGDLTITNDGDIIRTIAKNATLYPEIFKKGSEKDLLTLSNKDLQAIVKEVAYCVAQKDWREELKGIHFTDSDTYRAKNAKKWVKADDNSYFIAEATDAYRLARKEFKDIKAQNLDLIIPAPMLKFSTIFNKGSDVSVKASNKTIILESDNKRIIAHNYLEGYPNLDKVLPKNYPLNFTVDSSELKEKLNFGIQMLKGQEASVCQLVYSDEDQSLTVNYYLKDSFNSSMRLNNFIKEGHTNQFKISFNADYLMDALKANDADDKVILNLISDKKPIMLKIPEKENLTNLVVPLRTH